MTHSIITNPEARRYVLAIHGDGYRFLVGIRHDGGVDFGDGVTPDEAGMAFWKAFERAFIDVIADDCGVDLGGTE